jgi:hypothetical protein
MYNESLAPAVRHPPFDMTIYSPQVSLSTISLTYFRQLPIPFFLLLNIPRNCCLTYLCTMTVPGAGVHCILE